MTIGVKDIAEGEIEISAVRASGPGGQNVNKVSSAIHLRFDVETSSLSEELKHKIKQLRDHRVSREGVVVIKAQRFRSQEKNRADALQRLDDLLRKAQITPKARKPTKPSKSAVKRRLDDKHKRGQAKRMRGDPDY